MSCKNNRTHRPSVGRVGSTQECGSALVIVLGCLVLLTVLVVALLGMAQTERRAAAAALNRAKATALADLGADLAKAKINNAISRGSEANKTWASEPGRIWVFDIAPGSGTITREYVPLFSGMPGPDNAELRDRFNVDLNAPSIKGEFPIAAPAEGSTAATMKVGWENILQDPTQPASESNKLIGRIAYWVDDESCKVNINTADGSRKGNDGHYGSFPTANPSEGYSFGFGTPSEISLAGLPGLNQPQARAIADTAWEQEFATAAEIVRAENPDGSPAVSRSAFEAMRFDITHHNSSPDLNFMGEPRVHLLRTVLETGTTPRLNVGLGPNRLTARQAQIQGAGATTISGLTLDHIYPQPSQLSRPSYLGAAERFSLSTFSVSVQRVASTDADYAPGLILARYLSGTNQKGQTFTWPVFPGANVAGFRGKYTDRQLDSMVLQMIQTPGRTAFCDEIHLSSLPYIAPSGWLSGEPVMGLGRINYPTELLITVNLGIGDLFGRGTHPTVQMLIYAEQYWPKGHAGMPNQQPFDAATQQFRLYGSETSNPSQLLNTIPGLLNFYDRPALRRNATSTPLPPSAPVSGPGLLGTTWMDQMLRAEDTNGVSAGVDFYGTPREWDDTDQARAGMFRPYTNRGNGTYHGSVANPAGSVRYFPLLEMNDGTIGAGSTNTPPVGIQSPRFPGTYLASLNRNSSSVRGARPGLGSIRFVGGLQFWMQNQSSVAWNFTQATPFGSILPIVNNGGTSTGLGTPSSDVRNTVLPVDFTVGVPGSGSYLLRTSDPLVNLFPGDWEGLQVNPLSSEITMRLPTGATATSYARGGQSIVDPAFDIRPPNIYPLENFDGDNPGLRPAGGGDPLSIWLPRQDNRIPRQARFPSVGGLFSMRTGLFPDKSLESAAPQNQRGTPFRGLNLAPSTESSQSTSGGTSYPDWVLLDFVTVPFLPTKPYGPATSVSETQPFRRLTYGGATVGRMNINNPPVPFPFDEDRSINQQPPVRNALQALFFNLKPSNSYNSNGDPIYTTIDKATARSLAQAVADYQKTNGPFFLQGEIANVPAVANFLYRFSAQTSGPSRTASITRNDLVRDVVGAITTRSNTYSVWIVAQTIQKRPGNTNFGQYEPGDQITAEVRRRYFVERSIWTGQDGVPGNANAPVVAGTPNAYSNNPVANRDGDPASTSAPFWHPRFTYPLPYRWRTLAVENIQP